MTALPNSPASERNRKPILDVLREEFRNRSSVLEIGSGTGQHAVWFAAALPHLTWQTSDLPANHEGILAWLATADSPNLKPPLVLDVETFDSRTLSFDAVFSANTAHIMSIDAVGCMFRLVGRLLPRNGIFCLYGPFNFEGRFSSDSNAEFDAALRQRDSTMGIRDLGDLDAFAAGAGMSRVRLYPMPANNHIVVWQKSLPAAGEPET